MDKARLAEGARKRELAVALFKANSGKSQIELIKLCADQLNISQPNARYHLTYAIKHGLLGETEVQKSARGRKASGAVKVKAPAKAQKKVTASKSADEVAEIKEKNLKRLKEVGEKFNKTRKQLAKESDEAKSELDAQVTTELEGFEAPAFLTKRDLVSLV